MMKKSYCLLAGVVALIILWPGGVVYAAVSCGEDFDSVSAPAEYIGGPTAKYTLEQPFGGAAQVATLGEYIQLVYQFALGIVGIIAVVLIMFGGLRWLAAAGNESAIGEAKEIITSAVSGLVIALLSYTILAFINPQTLNTDVSVFKIPIPVKCDYEDPETETIPDITPGLAGNGKSICTGAVIALQAVVDVMLYGTDGKDGPLVGKCPGCTLDVSSGLRTHEEQRVLRDCYDQAVASGVSDGSSCPSGCTSCNLAEKVCCSKHEQGIAVDVALTNVALSGYAPTGDGFRKAYQNNGGAGGDVNLSSCVGRPDVPLCETQRLTNNVMVANGTFTGVSSEWWHFKFTGVCGSETTACTEVTDSAGNKVANNAYCYARSTTGTDMYRLARCSGAIPSCDTGFGGYTWYLLSTGPSCDSTSFSGTALPTPSETYATKPTCYTAPDYAPSTF